MAVQVNWAFRWKTKNNAKPDEVSQMQWNAKKHIHLFPSDHFNLDKDKLAMLDGKIFTRQKVSFLPVKPLSW